jgi:outer membrane protein assembly factor BamB
MCARAKLLAAFVVLSLLAFVPSDEVDATSARHGSEPWVIPPVQWNASLDAGYISTAPLITPQGIVVVKVGGSVPGSDGNEPAGLWAFRADTGEVVWRYNHSASSIGFEVAPMMWLSDSQSSSTAPCGADRLMVVTGWTSGQFTAIDLATGEEVWSHQTEVTSWGITGAARDVFGHLAVAGENSIEVICALNGTLIASSDYGNDTAYRSGVGISFTSTNMLSRFLQGTESGHLLITDYDGNLLSNTDLVALANLSGEYSIQSTPSGFWMSNGTVHLKGDGGGILLHLHIDDEGNVTLLDQTELPAGAGTNLDYAGMFPITSTSEGVIFWIFTNGTLQPAWVVNATSVAGEVSIANHDSHGMFCISQNTQNGSWLLHHVDDETIEWQPDRVGYLTAACAGDGLLLAGANDASWLEVRYRDEDYSVVAARVATLLGSLDEEPEPEPEDGNESEPTFSTGETIPVFLSIPFFGVALIVGLSFLTPDKDLRRQILIFAAIAMLVAVVMLTPFLTGMLGTSPEASSSDRQTASSYVDWKSNAPDMVSVAFHFPRELSPVEEEECGLTHLRGNSVAQYILPADSEHCIIVVSVDVESGMTVGDATVQSLDTADLDHVLENQLLGLFVKSIGSADGGDDNRWWTYDLNGEYGSIGISDQSVVAGDEIDWHFDDGGY